MFNILKYYFKNSIFYILNINCMIQYKKGVKVKYEKLFFYI